MNGCEATEARALEVHKEANNIGISLDDLADEINNLEGQLVSVLRPEGPIPVSDSPEHKLEGPSTQLAQTLYGQAERIKQLRRNIQSIKNRLEV